MLQTGPQCFLTQLRHLGCWRLLRLRTMLRLVLAGARLLWALALSPSSCSLNHITRHGFKQAASAPCS